MIENLSQSPGAAEPNPEELGGTSFGVAAKRLFLATRPKFFPASVLPVIAGCAWGYAVSGRFDALASLIALLATMVVHAAANVLNDVGDELNGSDAANVDRLYPFTGGSRFIQNGVLTIGQMRGFGFVLLLAAMLLGLCLIWLKGWIVLLFGLVGAALAVFYSLPPAQLSGRGLGEVIIAVSFGVLPVTGAAWLQSGVVDLASVLVSVAVGCWVAAILLINEVPDIRADALAGKRTWPVRFGYRGTRVLYTTLHGIAFASLLSLYFLGAVPIWWLVPPLALLAAAVTMARAIPAAERDTAVLLPGIRATLAIQTLGCLWVTAAALTMRFLV